MKLLIIFGIEAQSCLNFDHFRFKCKENSKIWLNSRFQAQKLLRISDLSQPITFRLASERAGYQVAVIGHNNSSLSCFLGHWNSMEASIFKYEELFYHDSNLASGGRSNQKHLREGKLPPSLKEHGLSLMMQIFDKIKTRKC